MIGEVFTATFSGIAVAAAQDLFEILAPATTRIEIAEIDIGQYSDAGDAQDELLSIQIIRGFTTTGSGGSAVTPANQKSWGRASVATVAANNTTVATDGTAVTLHATSFNVRAGWVFRPLANDRRNERPVIAASERLVVRITAPADAVTMNGTIKFVEIGPNRVRS